MDLLPLEFLFPSDSAKGLCFQSCAVLPEPGNEAPALPGQCGDLRKACHAVVRKEASQGLQRLPHRSVC